MSAFSHVPVMLEPCLELLNVQEGRLYLDGTLGGGGHSEAILQRGGRVVGIDRDQEAIQAARERLAPYGDRFAALHGNFAQAAELLDGAGIERVDGALLDLGVSSHQLDTQERGFSFHRDAPLDMRMDGSQRLSAKDVLNEYPVEELTRILKDYGEERWAKRIAQFIVAARPLSTTMDLVRVIDAAMPAAVRREVSHPARRTFQAIRIEVNQELSSVEKGLESIVNRLEDGRRLVVITFHSLEDRIVKTAFRAMENPCICPPKAPVCVCGRKPIAKVVTRKPILPDAREIEQNSRAHSAKVRAVEHLFLMR